MEEIDIIELLKRVKEGNAPKKIEVKGRYYNYNEGMKGYFRSVIDNNYISLTADFDMFDILYTKIKILDKPIIEKLDIPEPVGNVRGQEYTLGEKINEIIDWINNREEN